MAKKGAAKKTKTSNKADGKKKNKLIEDQTFGLKNKHKSAKVQAHVQSVTRNVMNSGDQKEKKKLEDMKRQRAQHKAKKKAVEDERNALFGEALLAVKKKSSIKTKGGLTESKGRDADEPKAKGGQSRAMKMMFQMDAKEMEDALTADPNYVRTIEDEVELQRQKKLAELKAQGIKGTPITEASFKEWQERKRKAKQDEARKLVEKEFKKKKGGKGLSVLSGRDLFEYKRELFKDDEDAGDVDEFQRKGLPSELVEEEINEVAEKVQSNLFLDGDDDSLDDLDELDALDDE